MNEDEENKNKQTEKDYNTQKYNDKVCITHPFINAISLGYSSSVLRSYKTTNKTFNASEYIIFLSVNST